MSYVQNAAPSLSPFLAFFSPACTIPNLLIILNPNNRLLKLPRRHLPLEQNIQLPVTAPLQLRQPKERTRETNSRSPAPNKSTLTRQIPPRRVQHLTRQVNHRDLSHIIRSPTHSRRQRSQAHGAGLGDDGVGNWSEGSGVDEGDQDSEDRLRVVGAAVLRDRGADAEQHQKGAVCGGAVEEDVAAAEVGAERDREDCGDELEAGVY
jgi:hypothetical protein